MPRVSLRRIGTVAGKLAASPHSLAQLLALATTKLNLETPATRIFVSSGDELDDDDDVQLLREDEPTKVDIKALDVLIGRDSRWVDADVNHVEARVGCNAYDELGGGEVRQDS